MFYTDIVVLEEHKAKYSKWDLSVRESRAITESQCTEWNVMEETGMKNTLKRTRDLLNVCITDTYSKIC